MKRFTTSCLILLAVLALSSVASASIRYDIVLYTGFDDGWTLDGGSITTNGTFGPLVETDIVDWSILFTSPIAGYTLTPSGTIEFLELSSSFTLLADPDKLYLSATGNGAVIFEAPSGGQAVQYLAINAGGTGDRGVSLGEFGANPIVASTIITGRWSPGDTLVIATRNVPEPSTMLLLLCGLASLALLRR